MSATKIESLIIDIKGGDCVDGNRIIGKSNTCTYFISSLKNYDNLSEFFDEKNVYNLDLKRVISYMLEFKEFFFKNAYLYPNKMLDFESYCKSLIKLGTNPTVKICLRINDTRVFMRFEDNSNYVVNALRHIVYGDISRFVIEKKSNHNFSIYPQVNYSEIKNDSNDDYEIDDYELDE